SGACRGGGRRSGRGCGRGPEKRCGAASEGPGGPLRGPRRSRLRRPGSSSARHASRRNARQRPCAAHCEQSWTSWPCLALLSEFDVLADDRVVLLQDNAVRVVTTVLPGHVGEAGASGGLQLDDGTYVLVLCH